MPDSSGGQISLAVLGEKMDNMLKMLENTLPLMRRSVRITRVDCAY